MWPLPLASFAQCSGVLLLLCFSFPMALGDGARMHTHVLVLRSALGLQLFSAWIMSSPGSFLLRCLIFSLRSVVSSSEIAPVSSNLHSACCCPFSDPVLSPAGLSRAKAPGTTLLRFPVAPSLPPSSFLQSGLHVLGHLASQHSLHLPPLLGLTHVPHSPPLRHSGPTPCTAHRSPRHKPTSCCSPSCRLCPLGQCPSCTGLL